MEVKLLSMLRLLLLSRRLTSLILDGRRVSLMWMRRKRRRKVRKGAEEQGGVGTG